MKKLLLIVGIMSMIAGSFFIGNVYSQNQNNTTYENIKVDVKNIDKGVVITVTSDDTDLVKHIQSHSDWYGNMYHQGYFCPDHMHNCMMNNNCMMGNGMMMNQMMQKGYHHCPWMN